MGKAKFDLSSKAKEQIYRSAKATAFGGVVVLLASYDRSHGGFSTTLNEILWGGVIGFAGSLTWETAAGLITGQPSRKTTPLGVQAPQPGNRAHSIGRKLTINGKTVQFENAIPQGVAGNYSAKPGSLWIWPWWERRKAQPQRANPTFVNPVPNELSFWFENVQLMSGDVWRFLRYAERNRTQGKGLSERYWTHQNRNKPGDWWNPQWYGPMMGLLDFASHKSRRQLVLQIENNWRILNCNAAFTYRVVCWAYGYAE